MGTRSHTVMRRWLAGWLVLSLLFAQAATTAYACPLWQAVGSAPLQVMADCAEMAGMATASGSGIDTAQPHLCKAHCDAGKQSPTPAADKDFSHGVVLLGSLAWSCSPASSPDPVALRIDARSGAPPGPPAGAAPLYIALQVLRI